MRLPPWSCIMTSALAPHQSSHAAVRASALRRMWMCCCWSALLMDSPHAALPSCLQDLHVKGVSALRDTSQIRLCVLNYVRAQGTRQTSAKSSPKSRQVFPRGQNSRNPPRVSASVLTSWEQLHSPPASPQLPPALLKPSGRAVLWAGISVLHPWGTAPEFIVRYSPRWFGTNKW